MLQSNKIDSSTRSISQICVSAALKIMSITLMFTMVLGGVLYFQKAYSSYQREVDVLRGLLPRIENAVSGEWLINDDRSVNAVVNALREEFHVKTIEASRAKLVCDQNSILEGIFLKREICITGESTLLPIKGFFKVASTRPSVGIGGFIADIFWISIGVLLFGALMTLKMIRDLKRSIVIPMQGLAEKPDTYSAVGPYIAKEIVVLGDHITRYIQEHEAQRDHEVISMIASQVAHDIQSPLVALNVAMKSISALPENERLLIRSAVSRIRDITNNLLNTVSKKQRAHPNRPIRNEKVDVQTGKEGLSVCLIAPLVETLVAQKRLENRMRSEVKIEMKFDSNAYFAFSKINRNQLNSSLSNMINNSMDAIKGEGTITVGLDQTESSNVLSVRDTGGGVPEECLSKITEKHFSFGKQGGLGLGLYCAKVDIESWGGDLDIQSSVGEGTTVSIHLPKAVPPAWFVSSICIEGIDGIVIIDDDPTIHYTCEAKFGGIDGQKIIHFYDSETFSRWWGDTLNNNYEYLFLVDYELIGSSENGIGLIEKFGLAEKSILVTSHYDDQSVKSEVTRLRLKLLPKAMMPFISVTNRDPRPGLSDGSSDSAVLPRLLEFNVSSRPSSEVISKI